MTLFYLCATLNDTKDWKLKCNLPCSSCVLAPCLASTPLPGRRVMTTIGLPIDENVGGIT